MNCKKCERPERLCECFSLITARAHVDNVKYPAAIVDYGKEEPGQSYHPRVYGNFSFFKRGRKDGKKFIKKEDLAKHFCDFLNSDAIFDCVIPKRFLEPERSVHG